VSSGASSDAEGESAAWSRFEHAETVALDYVHQWCVAVQMQAGRCLETPIGVARWVDADFLILALRNAKRAAEFAAEGASATAVGVIDAAVKQFDQAVPGLEDARNMIEHFNEYEQGTGNRQQPGVSRRARQPCKLAAEAFSVDYVGPDPDILMIGDHTISIAAARNASRELHEKAYLVVRHDERVQKAGS